MTKTNPSALRDLLDHLTVMRTTVLDQIVRTGGKGLPPTEWSRLRAMLTVGQNICAKGEKENAEMYRELHPLPDLPDFSS